MLFMMKVMVQHCVSSCHKVMTAPNAMLPSKCCGDFSTILQIHVHVNNCGCMFVLIGVCCFRLFQDSKDIQWNWIHCEIKISMHSQAHAPSRLGAWMEQHDYCKSGMMLEEFDPIYYSYLYSNCLFYSRYVRTTKVPDTVVAQNMIPILCTRLGMIQIITSHTDGILALCKSNI